MTKALIMGLGSDLLSLASYAIAYIGWMPCTSFLYIIMLHKIYYSGINNSDNAWKWKVEEHIFFFGVADLIDIYLTRSSSL